MTAEQGFTYFASRPYTLQQVFALQHFRDSSQLRLTVPDHRVCGPR